MKIRKLHLKNIGVFDDEPIEFKECPAEDKAEIHILTGENGSGKTTILQALANEFGNTNRETNTAVIAANKVFLITLTNAEFYKRMRNNSQIVVECENTEQNNKMNKYFENIENYYFGFFEKLEFAVFSYSGYRKLINEQINLLEEIFKEKTENEDHPLHKSLDFVKDENSTFTVNQWLGRSLSKRALAFEDNNEEAKKFTENVKNLEKVITDVVGYEIRFKLKTNLTLVLVKDNRELDFDVLPDGLKSLISWIGDLLMRLDSLKWKDDTPIFDREIILFLDEIEVHLHPAWQRKVLPVVQKLFKNAQIFVSTHSPFVVNSVDDAWVYELEVKDGKAKVREVTQSNTAYSIQTVLREVFGIDEKFGEGTQEKLVDFLDKSRHIQQNNGNSEISKDDFLNLAVDLAEKSAEFQSIVFVELAKITQKTGEPYEI